MKFAFSRLLAVGVGCFAFVFAGPALYGRAVVGDGSGRSWADAADRFSCLSLSFLFGGGPWHQPRTGVNEDTSGACV